MKPNLMTQIPAVEPDDLYEIADILPGDIKERYSIRLQKRTEPRENKMQLGYMMLEKL